MKAEATITLPRGLVFHTPPFPMLFNVTGKPRIIKDVLDKEDLVKLLPLKIVF
ncbi:hypothetical protein BDFB_014422 [Asbolus verrucosus]|uniref:Uncharacterized protein n=1 Tax=Asbolus verrucosus TaxID=1661398 RepID=A0A482WDF0_ASBVE|nr:hypothetical protein BDFB_014422 [Asbolus verrucosus]